MNNDELAAALLDEAISERVGQAGTSLPSLWMAKIVAKEPDGTLYADIVGGERRVPCQVTQVTAKVGDTVEVRFQDGRVIVTANRTDPPPAASENVKLEEKVVETRHEIQIVKSEKADVTELTAAKADISELRSGFAEFETVVTDDLLAANANISQLQAADVTITGRLDAAETNITSLQAEDVTINGKLTAVEGDIDTLQANTADIATIRANSAKIKDVTAQQITAATGYISDLTAGNVSAANIISDHAAVGSLDTDYAQIDMANVNNAWITNGTIKDGAISSAMINDLSANKLTAGTINGSVINVTNLNADNITTGTINGQRIGEGSLSLDKLSEDVYTESEVDAKLSTMQQQIDGAIETWTGTEVPTLQNAPASSWTTAELKDQHVGDVYFVVNSQSQQNGYNYRFTKTGSAYSWQLIKDSDVTNALSRLATAEGKITTFESDISTLQTDTGTLKTKTQNLETSLGDKVDVSTFNELSSTVDENSASIRSTSEVLTNNGLTSSTNIASTVNAVSQTATGNSSKISQLTTTLGTNADGTSAANDVVHRVSDVEQDLDGITTRVSKTEAHIAGDFALSTTAAGTTAKVATITPSVTGWVLEKGVSVTVRFDKENTVASPTLNVNSTGAKAIRDYAGNALAESAYKWKAGTAYSFTYDGTYWRLQDSLLTSRITQAESTITQQADLIEAKVSKNGVIAAINLSTETEGGSAVKISAGKVNIEGAAIFTGSGRLSQSSLDGAYDASGTATGAVSALTTDLASASGTTVINGGHIATDTIAADKLNANSINTSNKLTIGALTIDAAADVLNSELEDQFDTLSASMSELQEDIFGYDVESEGTETHVDGAIDTINNSISDVQTTLSNKVDEDAVIDAINNSTEQSGAEGETPHPVLISGAKLDIATNVSFQGLTEIANAKIDMAQATALFVQMLTAAQIQVGNIESVHIQQRGNRFSFLMPGKSLPDVTDEELDQHSDTAFEGEVAFISVNTDTGTSTFYMNQSVVLNNLRFGDWKWYNRSNKHMTLQYVGEVNS